jgi:hypothetical protein
MRVAPGLRRPEETCTVRVALRAFDFAQGDSRRSCKGVKLPFTLERLCGTT